MDRVTVEKRKRPVGVRSWRRYVVAEDEWVASPADSEAVQQASSQSHWYAVLMG